MADASRLGSAPEFRDDRYERGPRLFDLLRDIARWVDLWGVVSACPPKRIVRSNRAEYGPIGMVSPAEVQSAFSPDDIVRCTAEDVVLQEGEHLNGQAAAIRALIQRSADDGWMAS